MKHHRMTTGPRSMDSLLAALETLRRAPDGAALLAQVERGRRIQSVLASMVERAFLAFLQNALERYKKHSGTDPTTRLKARLIARHAEALARADTQDKSTTQLTLPLLQDADALEQHLVAMLWATSETMLLETRHSASEAGANPSRDAAPMRKDEGIEPLIHTLAQRLDEALVYSADNIVRLKIVAALLARASTAREFEEAQDILHGAVEELLGDNKTLDERLQQARHGVNDIAFRLATPAESLDPVSADRQALLRRLEAEARRAERHRHPLSLALLGPDHLGDIDRLVGPNAGREVIRQYLESITSWARAYDVVAHCRPHVLVWMLPATETTQGLQALRKIQQHVADTQYRFGGRLRPLPTFSGAVTGYVRGEGPAVFLARAESLAARARNAGPDRIECEK